MILEQHHRTSHQKHETNFVAYKVLRLSGSVELMTTSIVSDASLMEERERRENNEKNTNEASCNAKTKSHKNVNKGNIVKTLAIDTLQAREHKSQL